MGTESDKLGKKKRKHEKMVEKWNPGMEILAKLIVGEGSM